MQLALAAESAPYVTPFEHAARTGLGLLMSVALVALMVSIALTTRMTRSLERLSEAAGAVAAGNLDRSVHESNDDEIGRLATAFNAMTESLRRTLAELSQQRALAAVGEFAATLSHEVRNALTAIRVDLQHARRHLPVDNVGTSLVTRTLESVRRLDSTVTSALRVARSGQIAMSRVELGPVLLRAMQAAESSFTERGATLEPLANPIEDVMVIGDGAALEQLFMNLLLNAGQALTAGGRAHLEWERANGSVVVKVIDTGGGIAEEKLQLLGQPFQSSKPYGTGLGLPIARRIAAAHGGELLLESDGQVGTSAIVRLPLVDPRQ
jgi:signal transduction histidine kinase